MPVPTIVDHLDTVAMDPIATTTIPKRASTPVPNSTAYLLSLPLELRLQIYLLLLSPHSLPPASPIPTPLPISPLFIRAHYKTLFMSQHPVKNITTPLLRVSRQITAECLPILYARTFWRASCRLEQLASQIGHTNFGLIKYMEVDPDDLGALLGSLRRDSEDREAVAAQFHDDMNLAMSTSMSSKRLHFTNLERLHVNGYQTLAPTSRGTKTTRLEARALCFTAIGILSTHPILTVLVQVNPDTQGDGTGGADARDLSMGRVKWRFLRGPGEMSSDEHVVDLVEMIALFDTLIGMDEAEEGESGSWRGGVFRLYPYLSQE